MKRVSDKQARDLIVSQTETNFFVEASAGSGKTTSLVYRMVALVEKGVPVSEICTITFTKAAADEFFVRFQKLLSLRSVNVPDETDSFLGNKSIESVKRCQDALANIDLCFLGTIDAFLNTIAHEMPNEIGVPSGSEVISIEEMNALIKEEYEVILSNRDHPLYKTALMFEKLFYPSYECFVIGTAQLNECRNFDIDYDKSLLNINNTYFDKARNDLMDLVKLISDADIEFDLSTGSGVIRHEVHEKIKATYKRLKNKKILDDIGSFVWLVKDIASIDLFPGSMEGSALESNNIIEPKSKTKKSYVYTQATYDVLDKMMELIDNYAHTVYFHLITNALNDINMKIKKYGKFNFYDFLYYVTNAFKKSASTDRVLVDHIFERHSRILIDESQDTNPMQTELFFYLTGTKITDDWTEVEPKEGSLFIVGDPKQSIYAFRGANVRAYLKTKSIFDKKDEVLILTRNFRSNVELKDWFNASMNDILSHDEDALEHNDIPLTEEERNYQVEGALEKDDILLNGEYKYTVLVDDDPRKVAQTITELVNNKKYKIITKNTSKNHAKPYIYSSIEYSDFLIVPRNTRVDKYIEEFNEYHIPFMIEAKIPFINSHSLCNLISLVQLMKEPNSKEAFLNVFYSSLYGYEQLDVVALVNAGFNFDIRNIDGLVIEEPYLKTITFLHELYESCKGLSFSSTLLCLLNNRDLRLLKQVGAEYLEYTYFIIEKIKEREENGQISNFDQLKDYLLEVTNGEIEEERVLRFKDKVNRVKISNLHKVKGLEAPIVMLVRPVSKLRPATRFVEYKTNPPKAYFSAITTVDSHFNDKIITQTHRYSEEERQRWEKFEEAEKDRLAYVAATRAKSVLIVSKAAKLKSNQYDPWEKLSDHIDDNKKIDIPEDVGIPHVDEEDVDYITPDINEKCNEPSIGLHSPSDIVKDYKFKRILDNEDEIREQPSKDNATLIGTLVHRLMECLISSHDSYEDKYQLVDYVVSEYKDDKYRDLLLKVVDKVYSGGFIQKNSSVDQDIFKTLMNAKQVICEVPFSYRKGDTVIYGIIDLLYEDESGYHIIDYKTNTEDDVSILEKEYKSQLEDYKNALHEMGIEADAHIYHIDV